jgi:hypothetical protein
MTRNMVDVALEDMLGWPWRVEGLSGCVEEMDAKQLHELRDELEAERERLTDLVADVDELIDHCDEDDAAKVATLA